MPRVGFVTHDDPADAGTWSGIPFFILGALRRAGCEVDVLGPARARPTTRAWQWARSAPASVARKGRPFHGKSVPIARDLGRHFTRLVQARDPDVVVAVAAAPCVAYLGTSVPVVSVSDATFAAMEGYYPGFTGLSARARAEADLLERRAIERSSLLVFASEWAATSARSDYGADRDRVAVVPFGANLDVVPPADEVLRDRPRASCRLLFLGREWERKGGDVAVDAHRRLRARGVASELLVCGCTPPSDAVTDGVTVVPPVDKRRPADVRRLIELMAGCDFLLLPTRAECYGIVFCEASAMALPVVATDTGGVGAAVRDGVNGVLLPPDAGGEAFADAVLALHHDRATYRTLAERGRRLYDEELNWDAWAATVVPHLAALTGRRR